MTLNYSGEQMLSITMACLKRDSTDFSPSRCRYATKQKCWLSQPVFVCLCILHSCASRTAESPAAAAENTNMCESAQTHAHAASEQKWFQQKPGVGPRLPSQAAWLLIIAIGFESLLKQPRACVHVFKKQCYVSACHLEAFALQFSPTLAPFLSPVLSGIKVPLRGSVAQAWPDPLCHRGRLVSQWKKERRLIINISVTYNTLQALEEPAGKGNCHSRVESRPSTGARYSEGF